MSSAVCMSLSSRQQTRPCVTWRPKSGAAITRGSSLRRFIIGAGADRRARSKKKDAPGLQTVLSFAAGENAGGAPQSMSETAGQDHLERAQALRPLLLREAEAI